MKKLVFALAFSMAVVPAVAQMGKVPNTPPTTDPNGTPSKGHHGSWWLAHNALYHEAYINGYKSGWHHAIGHNTPLNPLSAGTIADGVDKFYADFRNRPISVEDAIQYTYQQMIGDSPEKLKAELLKLRAKAVTGGDDE